MLNIDAWENGCHVTVHDYDDSNVYFMHIAYYKPGSSLSQPPAKERWVHIEKSDDAEYRIRNYLNSIVNHIMFAT